MRKLLMSLIIATLISSLQAKTIECIGMDGVTHRTWKIIANIDTAQFIINGDILKAEGSTSKKSDPYFVWTEDFVNEYGVSVYDGIGFYEKGINAGRWFMIQKNSVTHELIGRVIELTCSSNK